MNFKKILTPKNTEEIKPNFFIQETEKGYRQVCPLAWNNEYRIKEQLKTLISLRTLFTIVLVLFIAWSYTHDIQAYQDFYNQFMENPIGVCNNVTANLISSDNPLEMINGNTNTLSDYP